MEPDEVLQMIREISGSHFDPVMVNALVKFIAKDRKLKKGKAG
jgi:HD-GYP domain-containing protein (c-di-GMP phosphodiesterase class II)